MHLAWFVPKHYLFYLFTYLFIFSIYLCIYLFICLFVYLVQFMAYKKQKPKDEMQSSQRPHGDAPNGTRETLNIKLYPKFM